MDSDKKRPKYQDKHTKAFADGESIIAFKSFERLAYRRLETLENADTIQAIMLLRSSRAEVLQDDRKRQYSIRINWEWWICFEWPDDASEPFNIGITDYH